MPKIILKGRLLVPDSDLWAVMAGLPTHIDLTRKEEGSPRFDVIQDETAQNVFSVYEEFRDQTVFDAHQERVRSSDWVEIASNAQRWYHVTEAH